MNAIFAEMNGILKYKELGLSGGYPKKTLKNNKCFFIIKKKAFVTVTVTVTLPSTFEHL